MKIFLSEPKLRDKTIAILLVVALLVSYAVYLIPDKHLVCYLGKEDGLFENLTAIFFLISSAICLRIARTKLYIVFFLLAILFFAGFGEEISWGQRVFGFETPQVILKENVQKEFNIHNLEIFNSVDLKKQFKTGIQRFFTVNFLFKIFWFVYGIILPLVFMFNFRIRKIVNKFKIPVPKISIGIFFFINYLSLKMLQVILLSPNESVCYMSTVDEIYECLAALVFLLICYDFYNRRNTLFSDELPN